MDFGRLCQNVETIHGFANIHQHLDLIAGLPYEDYDSFHRSFKEVYALKPQQLQLGFLKVLKGSAMERETGGYGICHKAKEPYEVLCTRWLSYEDDAFAQGSGKHGGDLLQQRTVCSYGGLSGRLFPGCFSVL